MTLNEFRYDTIRTICEAVVSGANAALSAQYTEDDGKNPHAFVKMNADGISVTVTTTDWSLLCYLKDTIVNLVFNGGLETANHFCMDMADGTFEIW